MIAFFSPAILAALGTVGDGALGTAGTAAAVALILSLFGIDDSKVSAAERIQ